jgi:hypothetical protein
VHCNIFLHCTMKIPSGLQGFLQKRQGSQGIKCIAPTTGRFVLNKTFGTPQPENETGSLRTHATGDQLSCLVPDLISGTKPITRNQDFLEAALAAS